MLFRPQTPNPEPLIQEESALRRKFRAAAAATTHERRVGASVSEPCKQTCVIAVADM